MITIYSKANCSQCDITVRLAHMRKLHTTVLKLDEDFTLEQLNALAKFHGAEEPRSFPVVTADDGNTYIGGFSEFKDALSRGTL